MVHPRFQLGLRGAVLTALVTLLAVAVGLLALLVTGLLRSHAEVLRALTELGIDLDPDRVEGRAARPAPRAPAGPATARVAADVEGDDPSGAHVRVAVTGVPHHTLLAFLSSTCLTCREFWQEFNDPEVAAPADARIVIVTRGADGESPSMLRKLAPALVHTVMSTAAWEQYGVPGAPYFVLVDGATGGVVGEGTATAWTNVVALMEQALADAAEGADVDADLRRAGIRPGDPSLYPEAP